MIGALLFPGTATYDPEFSNQTLFILGVHGQVFMAITLALALLGATAATLRTPTDPPNPAESSASRAGRASPVRR